MKRTTSWQKTIQVAQHYPLKPSLGSTWRSAFGRPQGAPACGFNCTCDSLALTCRFSRWARNEQSAAAALMAAFWFRLILDRSFRHPARLGCTCGDQAETCGNGGHASGPLEQAASWGHELFGHIHSPVVLIAFFGTALLPRLVWIAGTQELLCSVDPTPPSKNQKSDGKVAMTRT